MLKRICNTPNVPTVNQPRTNQEPTRNESRTNQEPTKNQPRTNQEMIAGWRQGPDVDIKCSSSNGVKMKEEEGLFPPPLSNASQKA
jgi:hypothetical protein